MQLNDTDDMEGVDGPDEDEDGREMAAVVHDPASGALSLMTLPMPVPLAPGEHLIQVHAVALTNGELAWPGPAAARPVPVPGYEVSGTVVLAPADSSFQPGTEVYACTGLDRPGNAREFTVAQTGELGQKPENLCWEEAATVPLSALTAWQALFVHGGLSAPASSSSPSPHNANRRVLITAAAGGVGLWAVQLARLAGVGHITATCGPANMEFVHSLGAHCVVDYTATPSSSLFPPTSAPDKFDLVLDCVGGDTLRRAWTCACDGGIVISVAMPAEQARPDSGSGGIGVGVGIGSAWFVVQADSRQLAAVTSLIEAGAVRAVFDSAFPLEQYDAAFEKVHGRHLRGKVVLRLA